MDHLLRQRYRESLAELTFNSRPIITSLTIIAGENAAHAHVIVAVIEDQLRNVAPNAKLPVLYLIDSICKNIGPVYTHLFSPRMFENFSAAYSVVAPLDREKFRKVVNTWKQPDPRSQGRPLFGIQLTGKLEAFMMSFRGGPGPNGTSSGTHSNGSTTQLRPIQQYPRAPQPSTRPTLPTSAAQIPSILPAASRNLSPTVIILQQQIQGLLTQFQNNVLLNPMDSLSRERISVLTQLLVHVGSQNLDAEALKLISQHLAGMMTQSANVSPNLVAPSLGQTQQQPPPRSNGASPNLVRRENRIPMQPAELPRVALSNADIQRKIPRAHLHLYDPTTLQCAQCAARFPGTNEAGRKQNSAHLDWHFRQNKKMRERGGRRAVCREWYLDEDTWVKEDLNPEAVEVEVADKAGDLFGLKEMDKKAASEVAEVVVQDLPAEEAGSGVQCGICREPLEQYYNDEEDMWMIKGAVKVDGVIYHHSCYTMSAGGGEETSGKRKVEADEPLPGTGSKRVRA